MEYTNFSRKQAGVLYAANKDRRIMMTRECVKQMYNLADTRCTDNTELRDCFVRAVDALFSDDLHEACWMITRANELTAPLVWNEEELRYMHKAIEQEDY